MSGVILIPESGSGTSLEWVNAFDYGAVGDGLTNNTASFAAAIAAATADNRPVYIPPGSYVTGTLTLSGTINGFPRLIGAGMAMTTLVAAPGTNAVIALEPAAGQAAAYLATVEHLSIDGNSVANYGVLIGDTVSRTTVHHVQVYGCTGTPGAGIANVNTAFSTAIDRCMLTENTIGARFQGNCQDLKITNSQLYGNLASQISLGNGTSASNLITIENCQIERGNQGTGGDVSNLVINGCLQVVVRSCYFESHTTVGSCDILFPTSTEPSFVYLENMYSSGNHGTGGVTPANYSIVLPNDTTTAITIVAVNCRIINFTDSPPVANSGLAGKSVTVMDQAGNIGYGTWTPQFPLDIHGSASFSGSLTVGTSSTMGNRLNMVGPGPDINAGSATTMNLNYNAGNGIMVWNGQAGTGHALFRADGPTYDGVQIKGGAWIKGHLSGSVAWTPGAIAAGAAVSTTVAVASCLLGDTVVVGFSLALPAGCILSGNVTAAGVVTVTLANLSGAAQTINAGTIRADCWEH